ncbi:MAG: type II and III secretion system protein family protein [Phycisphaerae bacterium]|nr:type II and III secretion system protein family protein [Phycisphaerae bacterium]
MIRNQTITESRFPSFFWTAVAAFAAVAASCPSLCGQTVGPGGPVDFKVTELPHTGKLISVAVNKGVLVDFNVPLREVRIANPDIADAAPTGPKQILINGKSFGTTQLVALLDGEEQRIFDVAVDLDMERLQASIRSAVPHAQVRASSVLDTVVLTGTVPDAESAQKLAEIAEIYAKRVVNHLRVAGVQQVVLRCTVAEVNRTATRQLGFNGWIAGDNMRDVFGVSQVGGINPVNIGAAGGVNVTGRIPFATDQNGLNLTPRPTLSFGFPRVQMQVFIQALRENGLLRVLAEPNLIAISGQEAEFLAGGEIPIPVPQGMNQSITIEYREYGVKLRFTPAVMGPNAIRLKVAPEVSEPDYATAVTISGYVVPGLTQRRVETTVELAGGQTFAIGGLLSERVRGVARKVPALGDVPVLGALFSSVDYQSQETELVVLVTPELVAPLSPDQIAYVPGAEMVNPNDCELFFGGQLEGQPARVTCEPEPGCDGPGPVKTAEVFGPAVRGLRGPVGPAGEEGG